MNKPQKTSTLPLVCLLMFAAMPSYAATETITENYSEGSYTKTVAAGDTLIYSVPETASEGGAIMAWDSGTVITITTGTDATVIFENNSATNYGGALRSKQGDVVLQNTVFRNNTAGLHGGAIYVTGNFILNTDDNRNLSSYNNTANAGRGSGGFLFLSGGNESVGYYTTATFNIGQNATYTIGSSSNSSADTLYTSYGNFKKTGAGNLIVNSNAHWGGPATVEAGVLEFNGGNWNFDQYGLLNVESGATLTGNGTFTSPTNLHRMVTIKEGATLAPGSGVGTMTIGDLTLEGGSILKIENGDSISVGNLVISSSAQTNKIVVDLVDINGDLTNFVIFKGIGSTLPSNLADYFEFNNFEGTISLVDGKLVLTGTATAPVTVSLLSPDDILTYALTDNYTLTPQNTPTTQGAVNYLPQVTNNDDGTLTISFTPLRPGYTYEVQYSTDLESWTTLESFQGAENASEEEVISPDNDDVRKFLRLKITAPQQ